MKNKKMFIAKSSNIVASGFGKTKKEAKENLLLATKNTGKIVYKEISQDNYRKISLLAKIG